MAEDIARNKAVAVAVVAASRVKGISQPCALVALESNQEERATGGW